jgi:hypothetical protein
MALQPSLRPLLIAGRADAPHTLDIFRKRFFHAVVQIQNVVDTVDYVCPFR